MPEKIKFTKMHGGGNDFMVIDAVTQEVPMPRLLKSARQLADRRRGIGCDQILILRESKKRTADFQYQIINSDGGEVGQCGNGARCAHAFLQQRKLTGKKELVLHTKTTTINTQANRNIVRAHLALPQFAPSALPMKAAEKTGDQPQWYDTDKTLPEIRGRGYSVEMPEKFAIVSLGNPHAVCPWPRSAPTLDSGQATAFVRTIGAILNNRRRTFPEGVNVGFYQARSGAIDLRVFERGAGETPSCGSGAAAAALVYQYFNKSNKPVQVKMTGGDLVCHWPEPSALVWLEGEICFVYDGEIAL